MGYTYSYNYDMAMEEALDSFAAMTSVSSTVSSVLGIAVYVFTALALFTIAKRRGISKAWLAWIPVADLWILGSISDQFRYVVKGQVKSKRKILLTLNMIGVAVTIVVVVLLGVALGKVIVGSMNQVSDDFLFSQIAGCLYGMLGSALVMLGISIARMIVYYMALYDVYTSCEPDNNVLYLVLSIIPGVSSVAGPLLLFLCREKDGGMPPRRPEPVYQGYTPAAQWTAEPVPQAESWHQEPAKEAEPWHQKDVQEAEPWNNVEE